ncbi:hypothetical protein [Paenibacillus oryzisoli]|uniref:Uncharacterized protein n=1 Tax=Paenibacillus oryzisoli TaxID=1850517 RepID=A0A198ADX6_9BACL|nr:hypothetical protein [Paenibacillus oryzisoli]OAS19256.1 hypothetical protein A8708_26460 [Paenibacillus oryzisoli]
MITVKRRIKRDGYNYTVDFHVRKEAIDAVYGVSSGNISTGRLSNKAVLLLRSGVEIETEETEESVLKMLTE